mmetsp:Transcript_58177/g.108933  ORF Transcript_58177/g.108933 Transcript_58177/m.108933 type:complete len:328 (-) Transcript_58177:336-1319(-)
MAMPMILSSPGLRAPKRCATKERLPTISEDECQDLEEQASQIRRRLVECFGDLSRSDVRSPELISELVTFLKAADQTARREALTFLVPALAPLALSEQGVRVGRVAVEVATSHDRPILLQAFRGSVMELCQSKSGHELLVLLIDTIPVFSLSFMVCEMIHACEQLSQHRYASNVIESMLLHFHPSQLAEISLKLVEAAPSLARHPQGSRVLQTLIEYGSPTCRQLLFRQLMPDIAMLTMHRAGSQVLRKALETSDASVQQMIAAAVLDGVRNKSVQVVNIACSRCGSTILQQIACCNSPIVEEIQSRLIQALPQLEKSRYGRRLVHA